MNQLELIEPPAVPPQEQRVNPLGRLAHHIEHADIASRAALARLSPDAMLPHQIAALSRALIDAGLQPETWRVETWERWALLAQGMALAGHDGTGRLGQQLQHAGVAESRVTRLLVSRGDALLQIVPRLLRLLASKQVRPNWHELGELILKDASDDAEEQAATENRRLRIAGDYYSAQARQGKG